mgnify:FL=1
MRLPSRVTPYRNSTFAEFPKVLSLLKERDMYPQELYRQVKGKNFEVADFIEVMDCLYLLGRVELSKGGVLRYVDGSQL